MVILKWFLLMPASPLLCLCVDESAFEFFDSLDITFQSLLAMFQVFRWLIGVVSFIVAEPADTEQELAFSPFVAYNRFDFKFGHYASMFGQLYRACGGSG